MNTKATQSPSLRLPLGVGKIIHSGGGEALHRMAFRGHTYELTLPAREFVWLLQTEPWMRPTADNCLVKMSWRDCWTRCLHDDDEFMLVIPCAYIVDGEEESKGYVEARRLRGYILRLRAAKSYPNTDPLDVVSIYRNTVRYVPWEKLSRAIAVFDRVGFTYLLEHPEEYAKEAAAVAVGDTLCRCERTYVSGVNRIWLKQTQPVFARTQYSSLWRECGEHEKLLQLIKHIKYSD